MKHILKVILFTLILINETLATPQSLDSINWDAKGSELIRFLSLYLAINTTNPPGNENKACFFLKSILARNGIPSKTLISPGGGYNLLSIINGDNSKKPILLLNHSDVYSEGKVHWEMPPFGGEIKNGFLYGRGALDMKGMAIMELFAFMEIQKSGIKLKRDLVFLATADGESFGTEGAKWIVENKILKVEPEYVLGEGFFALEDVLGNRSPTYLISIGEKRVVFANLIIPVNTLRNIEGYNTGLKNIESILKNLNLNEERVKISKTSLEFFKALSKKENLIKRLLLENVSKNFSWWFLKKHVLRDSVVSNLLFNNIYPTELNFSESANENNLHIKAEISINENESVQEFIKKIKMAIGIEGVKFEIDKDIEPSSSNTSTEFFTQLSKVITDINKKAVVVPYTLSYPTDLRFFRKDGIAAYGITPIILSRDTLNSFKNVNERIPIGDLGKGVHIIYETVLRMNQ